MLYTFSLAAYGGPEAAPQRIQRALAITTHVTRLPITQILQSARTLLGGEPGPLTEFMQQDLTAIVTACEKMQTFMEQLQANTRQGQPFPDDTSHDMRSPLNAINGFSRVILKGMDGPLNAAQQAIGTDMNQTGKQLLALVDDFVDIFKLENGRVELARDEITLPGKFGEARQVVEPWLAGKPVQLTVDTAPNLPPVSGDNNRLSQILLKLIANAVKFTAAGSITLYAQPAADGQAVEVSLTDSGCGLAGTEPTKLLGAFRHPDQLPAEGEGQGFSLRICHGLITLHGGQLWVESAGPNLGAKFCFTLPVHIPAKA